VIRRSILVYRSQLLPISETFIDAQVKALKRFSPHMIGFDRSVPNTLHIPNDSVICSEYGRFPAAISAKLYYVMGVVPTLYRPELCHRLEALKPSFLHAHFAPDAVSALPLAKRLRIPLVVTLHGHDVTIRDSVVRTSVRGRSYLARRARLWRSATAFLCDSEFLYRKAVQLGFPEHKLQVHYIGTDCDVFTVSNQQRQKNLVLFVGRLVEKKGCEYLIRAVAELHRQQEDSELVIIGDGPLRQSLELLSRELGLTCRFLGSQPSCVIRKWLAIARVFCAPSLTAATGDSEGLGLVFAEAQASGTPVVSFDHGGIPEVVRDGETGLLAPERDYRMLASHLHRYLTDDDFWQQSSARGAAWIREAFNLSVQTRKLEAIYESLLDGAGEEHAETNGCKHQ
jgi:colanic acid/amylovoran biosynthesis glycosyltransferase